MYSNVKYGMYNSENMPTEPMLTGIMSVVELRTFIFFLTY